MKYAFLIGDGMSDRPVSELNGRTPLEAARTPAMDEISSSGALGLINNYSGKRFGMNSDVCIMNLLGYPPEKFYTGRGPLEAASMGINLETGHIAFRCNLGTVSGGTLADYSAGHITTGEARVLINLLNSRFRGMGVEFYHGVAYRHLAVVDGEAEIFKGADLSKIKCFPPHDVVNRKLEEIFPRGRGSGALKEIMLKAGAILEKSDVNYVRTGLNENPANIIWLWGQGKTPSLEPFPLKGAAISAVDVVKGISRCAGLKVVNVPGATGYFDTDYAAKGRTAAELLDEYDFVLVHVEAPDEAGHMGKLHEKLRAVENFDSMVVKPVLEKLKKTGEFRLAVLPDHSTPLSVRTHTDDPIPFACTGAGFTPSGLSYSEKNAGKTGLFIRRGHEFLGFFLAE